jgi:hypothetical protein
MGKWVSVYMFTAIAGGKRNDIKAKFLPSCVAAVVVK